METKKATTPPKPRPVQSLLALALLFQVKNRLKREDWMVAREVVSANPYIFSRITRAIERDYNYDVKSEHLYEAVVMLLVGYNIDVAIRPR